MSATFHAEGSNSQNTGLASFSVVNTISAGDAVVVLASWDLASTTTPTVVTTGGVGSDTLTLIYGPLTGFFKYGAWFLQSAGSGRTGITMSWASSSPGTSDASCMSFNGLANPTLDQTANGTASTSPAVFSAATPTLSSADEFAAGFAACSGAIISADAPWIDDGVVVTTNSWAEHRILTATTAVNTNFTKFAGSSTWLTFVLTFMATNPFTGYVFGVGQRPSAPTTKMIGY